MKNIEFKVLPQEGAEKEMMIISALNMEVAIGGEQYSISFAPPAEPVVKVKLQQRGHFQLKVNSIVMICPSENPREARSNNKGLIINGQTADVLCDFSISKRMDKLFGCYAEQFVEVKRGVWVNKRYIAGLVIAQSKPFCGQLCVELRYADQHGNEKSKLQPISKRNLTKVKRIINNIMYN